MSEGTALVIATQRGITRRTRSKSAAKKAETDPNISEMVAEAITILKERKGSSFQAIKKHISAHYKVDMKKLSPIVKKYLKNAVEGGILVQTKGQDVNGLFKLCTSGQKTKKSHIRKATKASSPLVTRSKAKTEKKIIVPKKTIKQARKSNSPKNTAAAKKKNTVKKAPKLKKPRNAAAIIVAKPKKIDEDISQSENDSPDSILRRFEKIIMSERNILESYTRLLNHFDNLKDKIRDRKLHMSFTETIESDFTFSVCAGFIIEKMEENIKLCIQNSRARLDFETGMQSELTGYFSGKLLIKKMEERIGEAEKYIEQINTFVDIKLTCDICGDDLFKHFPSEMGRQDGLGDIESIR